MQTDYTAPPRGTLSPDAARPFLIAEFGHCCFRCGLEPSDERRTMDIDHIIPVARGGGNYYGNYQFLCGPCNSWKGTQIIDFRPGEPRKIDAGLLIIPNEERARKSPVKVVPIHVPSLDQSLFLKELAGGVKDNLAAALDSGDDATLTAAKKVMATLVTEEARIAIVRDPEQAARSLLNQFIAQATQAIDAVHTLRQSVDAVHQANEAIARWETIAQGALETAHQANETTYSVLDLVRQRGREFRNLFFYALIVTIALIVTVGRLLL